MSLNISIDKRLRKILRGFSNNSAVRRLRLLNKKKGLLFGEDKFNEDKFNEDKFNRVDEHMSIKNVACIGGGYWGKNLIRNLYDLNVLSSVCEVDGETRQRLRSSYA